MIGWSCCITSYSVKIVETISFYNFNTKISGKYVCFTEIYSHTFFLQNFRESNVSAKEIAKLISRNIASS